MKDYALDEILDFVARIQRPVKVADPSVRYLCALFAELAYYHVEPAELDDRKRAQMIPSGAFQALVMSAQASDMEIYLAQSELGPTFVVSERGVVAVGLLRDRILFIGFRGTKFLFDWWVNVNAKLVKVNEGLRGLGSYLSSTLNGRMHRGYHGEALRISAKILNAVFTRKLGAIEHVVFSGHSLGGAVAGISRHLVTIAPSSVCIFGSPRYADRSAYTHLPHEPPTQVRRPGDVVPLVPPRRFGYVDHLTQLDTGGRAFPESSQEASMVEDLWLWGKFLGRFFQPHYMEVYRKEVGKAVGARNAFAPLVNLKKIGLKDVPLP